MSQKDSIKVVPQGDVAFVEFDLPGEKANKLSTPVMTRLREVLTELKTSSFKAVVMISNKQKIFIAGADIDEIEKITTKEDFEKAVSQGQEIFNMIEELPVPVIAAVNGACAGGGCELILACDYRMASEDPSTKIGLPETMLGIIPGFGGCVRMPRVVGLQNGLSNILEGKLLAAKKAQKQGLVDRLVHPGILREESLKWAQKIISEGGKKRKARFKPKNMMDRIVETFKFLAYSQARKNVMKKTHGHYPALLRALEVIRKTYGYRNREKALRIEREAFCDLAITPISKNLIHVFHLTEMVKKQNGVSSAIKPREVHRIGILGAGTMGGGIAYQAADKGVEVRMKDLNPQALGKGLKHASDLWYKLVKRRSIDKYQYKQKMDRISTTTDYSGFKTLDLVIEAIVEDMNIKKKVIAETAQNCKDDCIIATNTSSLSVTEMATAHPKPQYFAGMHFFNPVDKMPLVEVIRGENTSDETIATVYELSKRMGKMPVVVKDGPGFLVNRLLLPYMAEAAFLMQEGMSVEFVDRAYVKSFGMPMGPFALMDEVGLDVCIKVLKIFRKAFGERVQIAPLMDALEKSGRLGKKNQNGFYKYSADGKRGEVDQSIYSELGLPKPKDTLSKEECIERGVFAMVNECARALLDDHIVETPNEVDLAMIMGTGFPPFRGGLLRYADSLTPHYVYDRLNRYTRERNAFRLTPANSLKKMAETGMRFYK
jgi:3-hydroxyacyl-CoA dehydrogenase / enoyl-CoA hydratase / 3-hydroxybutyryl-CoA epimerase